MSSRSFAHIIGAVALLAAFWSSEASGTNLGPPTISGDCGMPAAGGSVACNGITESAYYAGGEGYFSFSWNDTSYGLQTDTPRILSQFEVLGPANSNATLVLTATGTTSITESSSGGGSINVGVAVSNGVYLAAADACTSAGYECMGTYTTPTGPSFAASDTFTVSTNTVYNLYLSMYAYQVNQGQLGATIDPNVTFSPSFESNGYTLIYSADATPPPPVPLPATAWLMLSGLGGIGMLVRKRRAAGAAEVPTAPWTQESITVKPSRRAAAVKRPSKQTISSVAGS